MGTLSATFGNGNFLLWMLEFFLFVIWFYLLITIFSDLFRDPETSGGKKALWTIFVIVLPYLGIFVYLIARGKGMAARSNKQMQAAQDTVRCADPRNGRNRILCRRPDRPGQGTARLRRHRPDRVRQPETQSPQHLSPA